MEQQRREMKDASNRHIRTQLIFWNKTLYRPTMHNEFGEGHFKVKELTYQLGQLNNGRTDIRSPRLIIMNSYYAEDLVGQYYIHDL